MSLKRERKKVLNERLTYGLKVPARSAPSPPKIQSRHIFFLVWKTFTLPNTIIFSDTLCRITRVRNIVHPRNFGTLFIYYSCTIFEFPNSIYWMVSDFIFHLRDNQAYLRDVKTTKIFTMLFQKHFLHYPWSRGWTGKRSNWCQNIERTYFFFVCQLQLYMKVGSL